MPKPNSAKIPIARTTTERKEAGPSLFNRNLVSIRGSVIRFRNAAARADEEPFRDFNLADFWLPPTPFSPHPTRLADREDLASVMFGVAMELDRRISPKSKSGVNRFSATLRSVSKFLEYGWLNGYYTPRDWTEAASKELLKALATKGWAGVLNLRARAVQLIEKAGRELVSTLVGPSHTHSFGYTLDSRFCELIGTNLSGQELIPAKAEFLRHLGIERDDDTGEHSSRVHRIKHQSSVAGMGESHLRQELASINILGEMDVENGLSFVPFADTVRLAKQYGRAGSRTANITPDTVAALLKEAHHWIEEVSSPVLLLLEDICRVFSARASAGLDISPDDAWSAMRSSHHLSKIETLLGEEIVTIGLREDEEGKTSLKQVIYCLATACFIVIAFLNARRRDEISHKKIGLHRRALRLVDRRLGLYQCEFFIEKTYKTYVPFFVGGFTRRAIRVMERLSDIARDVDAVRGASQGAPEDHYEDKLFHMPRIVGQNLGGGLQWFIFRATTNGESRKFVERALGRASTIRIHPHMFRRGYALIFHYRYENETLQAIAYQLGHIDLGSAEIYISDRGLRQGQSEARAFGTLTKAQIAAHRQHTAQLRTDIDDIAKERIRELVAEVVSGKPSARGQFARLVQRFHQRLGSRLDYSGLDRRSQARILGDALVARGHAFHPLPHANCAASPVRRSHTAGCFSKRSGSIARENASALTCTQCPYGHWVAGHSAAIAKDIERLEASTASVTGQGTLVDRRRVIEAENLREVLKLRTRQLASNPAKDCA
jgi:hypothetical protein